jgi:hypothetical protein
MATPLAISQVFRSGSHVGLYSLVAAVKGVTPGTRVWENSVNRNDAHSKKLELPVTSDGHVTGNRRNTKIVLPAQISIAVRFVLTIDEAIAFFDNSSLVEALSDLTRSCGGDASLAHDMAKLVLSERDAVAQLERVLCPEGINGKFRITVEGDVVYGSIFDYLSIRLELDGHHTWTNWLKTDFEKWAIDSPYPDLDSPYPELDSPAPRVSALLIYHKSEGDTSVTPMTTYEGFCYITRRCVGRSTVSDAAADEALKCLSRYKVGDSSMHGELDENSKTASPFEKAFVLGVEGSQQQFEGTSSFYSNLSKSSAPSPIRPLKKTLPEPYVSWRDLGATRDEEPGARGLLESFLATEQPHSKLAERRAWSGKPPLRFQSLAEDALRCAREALHTMASWPMGDCSSSPCKKRRTEYADQGGRGCVSGEGPGEGYGEGSGKGSGEGEGSGEGTEAGEGTEELLRLRRFLLDEGVWVGVIKAYLSDVANRLLQLKCEETGGTFDLRKTTKLGKGYSAGKHQYLKNVDEDTARKAMAQTSSLYAKRVREELRKACRSLWSMRVPGESWEMLRTELRAHFEL